MTLIGLLWMRDSANVACDWNASLVALFCIDCLLVSLGFDGLVLPILEEI